MRMFAMMLALLTAFCAPHFAAARAPVTAASAGPCPAAPARAIAVAAASPYGFRTDLAEAAVVAATELVQHAGFVPVTAAPTPPWAAPGPVCVPILGVAVSTGAPQAATILYLTRYAEPVSATVTFTLSDGRVWRGTRTESAVWYGAYVPVSLRGIPLSGIPIQTPQYAAERSALVRATEVLVRNALADLPVAPVPTPGSSAAP